jgi:hypothetical protein
MGEQTNWYHTENVMEKMTKKCCCDFLRSELEYFNFKKLNKRDQISSI